MVEITFVTIDPRTIGDAIVYGTKELSSYDPACYDDEDILGEEFVKVTHNGETKYIYVYDVLGYNYIPKWNAVVVYGHEEIVIVSLEDWSIVLSQETR